MAEQLEVKEDGFKEFEVPKDGKSLYVNYTWCKACSICVKFCPKDVFDFSALGQPVVSRPELCTLCMICVHRCPDFSIIIDDAGKEFPEPQKEQAHVQIDHGGRREVWWIDTD